ncbi:MAG: hypothetical protein E1N59_1382 [Puniceicoccaceae bacterium 5H]|nr:MAG: hypothetical protein E1N59_1382 [Puniceicoccaceae bacterium 5H]
MKNTSRLLAIGLLGLLPSLAFAQSGVNEFDVPTPLQPDYSGNQVDRVTGSPAQVERAVVARLNATWRNRADLFQFYDFKLRQDYDNLAIQFSNGRILIHGVAANERARDTLVSDVAALTSYEVESRIRIRG